MSDPGTVVLLLPEAVLESSIHIGHQFGFALPRAAGTSSSGRASGEGAVVLGDALRGGITATLRRFRGNQAACTEALDVGGDEVLRIGLLPFGEGGAIGAVHRVLKEVLDVLRELRGGTLGRHAPLSL